MTVRGRGRRWQSWSPLTWPAAVASIVLASSAGAQVAASQTLPSRRAVFTWDERQTLRMNVSYRDIVDDSVLDKLASGLPTTIVLRAYLFRESSPDAIVASFKTCRVVFDLWNEVYKLEISQAGSADKLDVSPTLEGVLRRCAEADRLMVAARSLLKAQEVYYMAGLVEVNPVSPEMLDRIKRWVSRPTSSGATAPGDALFGSFVGLFVARIGSADRQIEFRTQSFSL